MLLTNVNIKSCISECTNIDSGGIELSRVRGGVTERSKRLLQWHKLFGGTLGSILSDSESVSLSNKYKKIRIEEGKISKLGKNNQAGNPHYKTQYN